MPKAKGAPKKRPLTPQRDNFARHIVMGYSAAESYRRCYNVKPETRAAVIHTEAWKLLENPDVAQRVATLRERANAAAVVTRDGMLAEMQVNRSIALDMGKVSVAESASFHRARVAGLLDRDRPGDTPHDAAAKAVEEQVAEEVRTMFEIGRRVYFTLELGKRRAQGLLPPANKTDGP